MRISRKLMMVSAVALMGVSPLLTSTQSIQAASSTVYKTNSKTSVVRTINNAHFVDQNGKSIPIVAEKGGKYTVWNVKSINGETYYNVEKDSNYWIPSSATKGKVSYVKNGASYVISTNDDVNDGTVVPHASGETITLKKNAYVYNANGKRVGKIYYSKGAKLANKGTRRINGKLYYVVDTGYIKAGNVASSNVTPHASTSPTPSTTSNSKKLGRPDNWVAGKDTLKLKKNAIPYDENGKKLTNLGYSYIKKTTVLNYYGTKIINGSTYYFLGDGVYIKAANVGTTSHN